MGVEVERLRAAVADAAGRVSELVRTAGDPARPVPGSEWTVGDLAAHLAGGLGGYAGYLAGSTEPIADMSDLPGGSLAASNARYLAEVPDRDLTRLAGELRAAADDMVGAAAGRHGSDEVFWHGRTVPLSTFLALALGELLVHGLDLATALRRPWPLAADEARLVVLGAVPVLCLLVDPQRAAGVEVTYEIRLRGGGRFWMAFRNATLDARLGGAADADCRISADPVAFLLVSYGRRSQWSQVATGKLAAWGRRPWWAFRLTSLIVNP